ncbi:MAG: alpha/beta fold hydrolase [Clostridia bacterium]|nr:alpha/beta fold hydrolase [Clostridia bacterium]
MTEEKITVCADPEYPLSGCLTLPDHITGKVPAVVFVHGSGSSNMDEKIYKITPFRDLAHGLASRGIASVRYDKRSFAYGLKLIRAAKGKLTVKEETVADAVAAAAFLRADDRIDPDRVFIVGHSMGGMLAPRIDRDGGNFRGLIIMAGSTRRLEEILIDQMASMKDAAPRLLRGIFDRQIVKYTKLFDGLYQLTDDEAVKRKFGGGVTLYYFKEMGQMTAADYLDQCQKPMLIMQGSRDVQVSIERDFNVCKTLLSDRENVGFRLYDGLNHAFVPALYDSIKDAAKEFKVERHIGDAVIDDIAYFIHRN